MDLPFTIVLGSVAHWKGKEFAHGAATHSWAVYVRPAGFAHRISRVDFELDRSFVPHEVSVAAPPFEVVREGWGEFGVVVYVHTTDGATTRLVHHLRLHPEPGVPLHPDRAIISEVLCQVGAGAVGAGGAADAGLSVAAAASQAQPTPSVVANAHRIAAAELQRVRAEKAALQVEIEEIAQRVNSLNQVDLV